MDLGNLINRWRAVEQAHRSGDVVGTVTVTADFVAQLAADLAGLAEAVGAFGAPEPPPAAPANVVPLPGLPVAGEPEPGQPVGGAPAVAFTPAEQAA